MSKLTIIKQNECSNKNQTLSFLYRGSGDTLFIELETTEGIKEKIEITPQEKDVILAFLGKGGMSNILLGKRIIKNEDSIGFKRIYR